MEGGAEEQQQESSSPLIFGNYEVLKSIGKGKFAIVYRAKKIGDDTVVALKRIAVDMMNDKAREKCLKEVRLLQSLDHPNIIRYMDSFITDNDLMIVYEWAAAGDLKRQLRKAQERGTGFEERVIWKYFSQICNAMKHMHDKRIMHRDLKPANIFLTLDGTIKVGDLGLSRELSEHTIQAHSKVGTPLYMSPEVLKGEGYDFKSDIWSLGCLLYELAMLKSPFKSEGLNLYLLFQKISSGDYQPLPENYSEQLRSLTYSMISTLPEDRPEIAYVCKVAQEMRTLTAEKTSRSRKASAAGNSGQAGDGSRPNSGLVSRPLTEGGGKGGPEAPEHTDGRATATGGPEGGEGRVGGAPALVREGSFKLERVNSEWDEGQLEAGSREGSRAGPRNGPSSSGGGRGVAGRPSRLERGGAKNPRDASFDAKQQDEDGAEGEAEDEATVGMGQAPFIDQPLSAKGGRGMLGVVALGSDASPGRNAPTSSRVKGAPHSEGKAAEGKEEEEGKNDSEQSRTVAHADSYSVVAGRKAPQRTGSAGTDHGLAQKFGSGTVNEVAPSGGGNPYRRIREPEPVAATGTASTGRSNSARSGGKGEIGEAALVSALTVGRPDTQPTVVGGKTVEEHLEGSAPAFALMEAVYARLLVLGCPLGDPETGVVHRSRGSAGRGHLLPFHFACDLQIFGHVAGHDPGHPFMQFRRFAQVAVWLCREIGGAAQEAAGRVDLAQDTPITVAKQLLKAAQAACEDRSQYPPELTNATPTSLTVGHGFNVCFLLHYLSERALERRAFTPGEQVWQYGAEAGRSDGHTFVVTGEQDDDAISDNEDQGEAGNSDGEGGAQRGAWAVEASSGSVEDSAGSQREKRRSVLGSSMVMGTIDPVRWKEETERVAGKLAAASASRPSQLMSAEWADHLDALRRYCRLSGGAEDGQVARQAAAVHLDTEKAVGELQRRKADINGSLGRIRSMEQAVQRSGSVPIVSLSYAELKQELSAKESAIATLREKVSLCSAELARLQESCEEVAEALNAKTGGAANGSEGQAASGAGPVVRLKESLFRIKGEVKSMAAAVTLLNHRLLAEMKSAAATRGTASRRRQQQRASDEKIIDESVL